MTTDDLARLFTGSSVSSSATTVDFGAEPEAVKDDTNDPSPRVEESPLGFNPSGGSGIDLSQAPLEPTKQPPGCPPHPLFSVEQLGVDRRLIVNRKRQLKMYRVWMQGKFKKIPSVR